MRQPPPDLDQLIDNDAEPSNKLSELMRRLYKPEEDCDEGDCAELTCRACGSMLETVFGSLPLEVQCTECHTKYILRELLSTSLNNPEK